MEQQPFDVFSADCPSRAAWEHVTGRWGALVLGALADGPMRFGAVRRAVGGVSDRMLSQTLQALERDGLVHREDHGTNPRTSSTASRRRADGSPTASSPWWRRSTRSCRR